ncbi:MAG: hypothetical protein QXW60_00950 [Nitrososphaerota archaeon]
MSEAFQKARSWVQQRLSEGKGLAVIQSSFPLFREGNITINRVLSADPPLLGYFDDKLALKVSDGVVRAVHRVAKLRGLDVVFVPPEVRIVKDGVLYGLVREDGFAASDAGLFNDLAVKIYGLGGSPDLEVDVRDSWLNSLARLLSDKNFVETFFLVILAILIPPTLAAISLIITPSRFIPDPIRYVAVVAIFLVAFYVARLYVRENLKLRPS